jgi:hypothetical protein
VIDARNGHWWFEAMKRFHFSVPDEAVHRLIRLAYDASLMEEEGRYPTVRMVCSASPPTVLFGNKPPWDSPAIHDADALRKIAPTATRPGSALAMAVAPSGFADIRCAGLYEFADVIDPYLRNATSGAWEMGEVLSGALLVVGV